MRRTAAGIRAAMLAAGVVVVALGSSAMGANRTWNGASGNDFWSTGGAGGNWTNGAAPGTGADTPIFAGTTRLTPVNDFPANTVITGLTFNATATAAFTLTGNAVNLGGNITNSSVALHTIGLPINLTATRTVTMTTGGGDLLISGAIGETAPGLGLTLGGAGTLTLSGNNTYSGITTVGSATRILAIGSDSAVGTGILKVNGGGTIIAVNGPRTISNVLNDGAMNIGGTNAFTFTGKYLHVGDSNSTLTVNNTALTTFSGGIDLRDTGTAQRTLPMAGSGNIIVDTLPITNGTSVAGSLTYKGTGTLTLLTNNTYGGTGSLTLVSSGLLLVNNVPVLDTDSGTGGSAVTVNGTGTLGGTGTIRNTVGVSFGAGGKLSPGVGGVGTLTVDVGTAQFGIFGAVTAVDSKAMVFDVGPVGDRVMLTAQPVGGLNIGLGVLEFDDFAFTAAAPLADGTYTLIDTNQPIIGTLGTTVTGMIGDATATIAFGDGGNDLVLVVGAVPEPGCVGVLGGVAVLLMGRRRR